MPITYTILDDPSADATNPNGYGTSAVGINGAGQVVGTYTDTAGLSHGFLYSNGVYTSIDDPSAAFGTIATAINGSGEIAGGYYDSGDVRRGFLDDNGTFTDINDPLGTKGTIVVDLNDASQAIGDYIDSSGISHGFLYSGGSYTTIDDPLAGADNTILTSINASGQIVGYYVDTHGVAHSFLYSGGTYISINDPLAPKGGTQAVAINDSGQIVGSYKGGGVEHGFVYENGFYTTVDDPLGSQTTIAGINDAGQIIGEYVDASGNGHSFLYSDGTFTTLDDGTTANDINDSGQIAGGYRNGNGYYSFLATSPAGTSAPPTLTYKILNDPSADATNPNGYGTAAVGINDVGQVIGTYTDTAGLSHGFLYSNGIYTSIDDPLAVGGTMATAINASGEIAGGYYDSGDVRRSFLYSNGTFTDINDPSGTKGTIVVDLNGASQAVGYYIDSGGISHGLLFSGGSYTTIDDPLAGATDNTSLKSINDSGQVVGDYIDTNGVARSFLYSGGTYTSINDPLADFSNSNGGEQVVAINDSGQIVGSYEDRLGVEHGFVYENGFYTTVDDPLGSQTTITGINDAGQIIGEYLVGANYHSFLYSNGTFTTLDDGTNANDINDSGQIVGIYPDSGRNYSFLADPNVPCYCRGTLIKMKRGEKPVEKLQIGDKVMTMSGLARPIKWIGTRSYGGRFVMGRKDILPVCIRAGALDDNVPRRDLWISPHHAMYLEGVLVEAKDLLNGVSVVQAESAEIIEYFHIELESHDVIIAEGAPSESFIDDDSRGMFHNAHQYHELYPGERARPGARYCAPRPEWGYEVERVRRRIAARAGLCPLADAPRRGELLGFVDRIDVAGIEGWAQNPDHPDVPVCLDIFADDRLIGQVLADRYREDLDQAGVSSGCHAFAFTPPHGMDVASIEVRRSLDGAPLETSRKLKPNRRKAPCAAPAKARRRSARR
jgi:probable HAF family extracellular repeat protein